MQLEETQSSNEEGKILSIKSDSILIGCAKGSIRVYTVQAPSKKEVDILSYINGKRLNLENRIS